jgi:anti-sigma factor (TIGR02949 family)
VISCADAVRQLWEYLDNDLRDEERERVEDHLAFCRRCCGEAEFADELRGFLGAAARPQLPPHVEQRLVGFLDTLGDDAP